ncbi:MAG: DDE-type integrase/transposase/recombinase [Flavobacteriaceae bacterium]|nr:DDE-type integrase/transposase/recombinase [Flavobacteriaceae bacterium]
MRNPILFWATDITSMSVLEGRFYLCAIIDIDRRFVVGFHLSKPMPVDLCLEALYKAIEHDGCPQRLHTDQGSPLTSRE